MAGQLVVAMVDLSAVAMVVAMVDLSVGVKAALSAVAWVDA